MRKVSKISLLFQEIYLSKGTIISLIISNLILIVASIFFSFKLNNEYYFNYDKIHNEYLSTMYTLLIIISSFNIIFMVMNEAKGNNSSIDSMLESSLGRKRIILSKYIAYMKIVVFESVISYLAIIIPPYFFYKLFKIDNVIYLYYLLSLIEILAISLFIAHLFKNYFSLSVLVIYILIKMIIKKEELSFVIPLSIFKDNGIIIESPMYYLSFFIVSFFIFDYIIYNFQEHR